jgi:hypothetical protein
MINKILNEEMVIGVIKNILEEETSKVNRNDYSKVQFKMEELENHLIETIKELRKVEDSIPDGLKTRPIFDKSISSSSERITTYFLFLGMIRFFFP